MIIDNQTQLEALASKDLLIHPIPADDRTHPNCTKIIAFAIRDLQDNQNHIVSVNHPEALFHIDIISNHNIDISSKIINHKSDKIAGDIINIVKIDDDKYSCLSVLRKEFVDSELTINKNDSVRIVRGVKSD